MTTAFAPLLLERPSFFAVHKPPGVVVVPGRYDDPEDCLRRRLEIARGEAVWVVHRLDRDTSGVVVFARTAEAHRTLSMAFERGAVRKVYSALTCGVPAGGSEGTIDVALHPARKGKMRPARPGEAGSKPARTDYRVLATWATPLGPLAHVEARPLTGRQHQLRVHLRYVGAPLLVDPLYGGRSAVQAQELGLGGGGAGTEAEAAWGRLTLHAARLTLPDAEGAGAPITIEAPLHADLAGLIGRLDAASGL